MEIKKIKDLVYINKKILNNKNDLNYINYLDTANITKGKVDNIVKIVVKDIPSRAKRIVKENDIVYSTVRPNLCHYGILRDICPNMIVSTGFCVLSCKPNVNPEYLYHFLTLPKTVNKLAAIAETTTSTYPSIRPNDVGELEIPIPGIDIQNKTSHILSIIDRKIDKNNHINNNLYDIGLSLLSNYFSDVYDKVLLNKVITFVKGKKPKSISTVKEEKYLKYLTIAGLNGQELNYADTEKILIANQDLLMVMDGASSGDIYYCDYGVVGSTLSRLDIIDEKYIKEYIFFCLKKYNILIKSKNTGSVIPHTDKLFVGSLEIPELDKNTQKQFKVLLGKIQENLKENETLIKLRDALLPKLMNGEIDLENVEI